MPIVEAPPPRIVIDDRHWRKAGVILNYAERYQCPYMVETGTAYGEMVEAVRMNFERVYTIELKELWYHLAQQNFKDVPNVFPIQGDSGEELKKLMPVLDKRTVFWLDAHYSGGHTVKGRKETPIMEELEAILTGIVLQHVIVIDDLLMFQKNPAYPNVAELERYIQAKSPGASFEIINNEVIVIVPRLPFTRYEMPKNCQIATLSEIYMREFGRKRDGVFVDVGAYDGYQFSNTWGLAQAGWSGLCFEPDPDRAAQCRETYVQNPKVTVIQVAVGNHNGKAKLYRGLASTTNLETVKANAWGFGFEDTPLEVKMVTLNAALKKNGIPASFDVLSIDVDGAELDVLDGLDLSVWKPRIILLEVCKDHPIPSYHIHTAELEKRMREAGFTEIYHDQINSIFERKP